MEKIAIIKLNSDNIKMQFVDINRNKSFMVSKEVYMPVNLTKDFYSDYFIKPAIIKDVISVLTVFKKMIEKEEITETLCYATNLLSEAKNCNGILNEIATITGMAFNVVNPEDEINSIYTATINTFNKPKTLLIDVSNYYTSFLLYNRRNVLEKKIVPLGYETLYNKYVNSDLKGENLFNEMSTLFYNEIADSKWILELPEDFEIIGAGNMFLNLGNISRKAKKYPLDLAHNYTLEKDDFDKVYNLLKNQDVTKTTKIKGVSVEDSKYLPFAFAIINAILSNINKNKLSISRTGFIEGILFNYAIPLTIEKPISDTLGYSLQTISDYYDKKTNNTAQIYDLSMLLFKQLKVLHKLSRPYVRVLRIASYMYNSGYRINVFDKERCAFNIILNSDIYGVDHNEIVLAAFVAYLSNPDNFNLSEWIKYRDLITEQDLVAVKKLAVILRIAESLDITGFGNVQDINCDILGDSVIMKTVVKDNASLEIKHAMLCSNEFKKSYNKNLEIL